MPNWSSEIQCAICYLRKSREDEEAERRGEDTLARQRQMLLHDVLPRYDFAYEMAEEIASGDSIKDRPVFRAILEELGEKYQAIVCKDLSRLGRGSYADMGQVYDVIRDKRIIIITKDAFYDPRKFSDLRMIRFSLFFNREEYEMTLWRLTEGKYDGAARGKWVAGPVPYGLLYNRQTQTLEPDPVKSEIVRMIFDWYLKDGLGYQAITTRLAQLGIPSPRGKAKWRSEVIRRLLANPAYQGTLAFRLTQRNKANGKIITRRPEDQIIVEQAFPSIIEANLACDLKKRKMQSHQNIPVKRGVHTSELSGLIHCQLCQYKLIRQVNRKRYIRKDGTNSIYLQEFLYCKSCGYAVSYRICEKQILAVLKEYALPNPKILMTFYQNICAQPFLQDQRFSLLTQQFIVRKHQLMQKMKRSQELLIDGLLTPFEYQTWKEQFEQEIAELEANLAHINGLVEKQTASTDGNKPLSSFSFDHDIYSFADLYHRFHETQTKRKLIQMVIQRIELRPLHINPLSNPTQIDRSNISNADRSLLPSRKRQRNTFKLFVTLHTADFFKKQSEYPQA